MKYYVLCSNENNENFKIWNGFYLGFGTVTRLIGLKKVFLPSYQNWEDHCFQCLWIIKNKKKKKLKLAEKKNYTQT